MSGFDDVTLTWAGKDYEIRAHDLMPIISKVENILLRDEDQGVLAIDVLCNKRPIAKIAECFEAILRHAKAPVLPGEAYLAVMSAFADRDGGYFECVQDQVMQILSLLAPPVHLQILGTRAEAKGGGEKK
ncbi:hypothetical protein [Pseudogemmobacter humi]|uniref:Uncharacterized protein n=1 Tax=Pseudogemmobacter humi TaxID=2483812 RepID=A0A3P5XTR7_9RHOB|nr:hypothetical protein [Pseudogemmobacter humi]VDC31424.1 hypothetical protein XINFAN_02885 [Pseudogemmobacter humi]